jgi:hypothetical protein
VQESRHLGGPMIIGRTGERNGRGSGVTVRLKPDTTCYARPTHYARPSSSRIKGTGFTATRFFPLRFAS